MAGVGRFAVTTASPALAARPEDDEPSAVVRPPAARTLAVLLAWLAFYAALAAWLTWPLAAHLLTHLPDAHPACRFDTPFTGWLLAYESHRLATAPLLLPQANIYAPTPDALFYGPTAIASLPYFAPLFLATGDPTLALNVLFLGGVALTSTALHLVVRRWTGSHAAGVVAAVAFLCNRYVLWEFVPTAPIYALLLYFPLVMAVAADAALRWPRALLLLALVLAQEHVHFGYIAPSVLGPLAALALVRLARPATRGGGLRLAGVVALAALALLPELLAYRSIQQSNPALTEQTVWRGLAQPPTELPFGLLGYQMPTAVVPAALALIALGGALALLRRRREGLPRELAAGWRQASFWVVVALAMSLTPTVHLLGIPLATPRALAAHWLPFLDRLRVPARLSLGAFLALCVLAGLAFAECDRRVRAWLGRLAAQGRSSRAATALLALAVVLSFYFQYRLGYGGPRYLRGPLPPAYPLASAPGFPPDSPVLAALRQPGGTLLELPVGPGGLLPHWHTRAMYRSIFHWRNLVNGYDSYWPRSFPERMRLALALPDAAALAELHTATGVALVLVDVNELAASERAAWLELAASGGRDDLRLVARDGDALLFGVATEAGGGSNRLPERAR